MRAGCLVPTTFGLWIAAAAAVSGGCARKGLPETTVSSGGPVVARVADVAIHASALAAQMSRTGGDRMRALDELVTFELLARAAAAAGEGIDQEGDLEAQRSLKVQRLVEREIEPRITRTAIDDSEVRAVYDRAKNRFVHGRLVQVAVLCVFTGARMKPEPRARAEAIARQLEAALAARGAHTSAEFEAVSKEPAWIERKVSFTTVWQGQGDDQPFPSVVGRAVQTLARPGQMTGVVGDETGYYLALYLDEKPPLNVSLSEAAPEIRQEMFEPWRRQKFLQLALTLAQGHDIEVFPENFALMAEPTGAPTTTPPPSP